MIGRPDPLQLPETAGIVEWRRRRDRAKRWRLAIVVAVAATWFALGVLVGRASASRTAQIIPAHGLTMGVAVEPDPALSEAPIGTTGASPSPTVASIPTSPTTDLQAGASVSGLATWYAGHRGEAAAGPALRAWLGPRWRGSVVTVCAVRCVVVRLTDWCACAARHGAPTLVDLSAADFASLAPLGQGVLAITVQRG